MPKVSSTAQAAKKYKHTAANGRHLQHLADRKDLIYISCRFTFSFRMQLSPKRKGKETDRRQNGLENECKTVTVLPGMPLQGNAHQKRTDGNADAIKALYEVHVCGFIVQGNKAVLCGINGAGSQSQRNCKQHQKQHVG